MDKIVAIIMSLLSTFSLFFGTLGDESYENSATFKQAVDSVINKNDILSQNYVGEVSTYKWDASEEYSLDNTVVLKKEKGKDFVILNITDMHFSDYDYRAFTAIDVEAKLRALVATVKPDLITVSGDIVCSDSTYYSIRKVTDIFESFGIPWAPFYGNHDDESNCDLNYLADIMMTSPHCVMSKGDPDMGVGNYIINIAEENDDGSLNVVESLIIMDSHHSQANEKQVEWFKWAANGINELTDNSAEISLMFHIPLPEYQYAYDEAWDEDNKCWKDGYNAYGEKNEKICCEREDGVPVQRGFFQAIKDSGTAKYVFCGHEHLNNFSLEYQGIRLTYCLKIGMGSGHRPLFSGGTQINVGDSGINRIMHKTMTFGPAITLEDIKI